MLSQYCGSSVGDSEMGDERGEPKAAMFKTNQTEVNITLFRMC